MTRPVTDLTRTVAPFEVISPFQPSGDQPAAIEELTKRIQSGEKNTVLLGATGTGKSATTAWLVEKLQRPTLVMAPNKTLAAQLATEFRELLPNNAIEYFVSYYDYYQPEAYVPQSDTFIEKDSTVNEEVERLRHSATNSLLTRRDVLVVATVSAIYGLGTPQEYVDRMIRLRVGEDYSRDSLLRALVAIQYTRNDVAFTCGTFRVRGDTVEVFPVYEEHPVRIEMFGDEIERMMTLHPVTGEIITQDEEMYIFPATHYVAGPERMSRAIGEIQVELEQRVAEFEKQGKLLEAQRIKMRTTFDIEMMQQVGFCSGIENYSRFIDGREPGSPPNCLIDYFPEDYLLVIDESHVTIPQIRAMFKADRSRKQTLVDHGFRLPSALDNRPLTFEEFTVLTKDTIYVSATPGDYEAQLSGKLVEQVVRPTGLIDPEISIRPLKGQIDDLIGEIRRHAERKERVLVTTLTKKSAERLSDYLSEMGMKVKYIHSELDALQRVKVICDLRKGDFDCLVGINLLREGIDLPEVALVAILDADKEGFLRSERSLIQVAGRAARNINGKVILYADKITDSIKKLVTLTNSRRKKQEQYNIDHHIEPKSIVKAIREDISIYSASDRNAKLKVKTEETDLSEDILTELEKEMLAAAEALEFERAAYLRDIIKQHRISNQIESGDGGIGKPANRRKVRSKDL